jgi:hypothetical protein
MIKPKHSIILLIVSVVLLGVVVIGLIVAWANHETKTTTLVNGTSDVHVTYAALYEAAWRQDGAASNTVVTATLMSPLVRFALQADTQRSQTDQQLWQAVKAQSTAEISLVVTYDSATAGMPDKDFTTKFTLTDAAGAKYTAKLWTPIIPPNQVVNTNTAVRTQMGVLTFSAPADVNWDKLRDLQLVGHNIDGVTTRTLTWAQPTIMTGQ